MALYGQSTHLKPDSGLHDHVTPQGSAIPPYFPKREVNAKEESKMKQFNTAGMMSLTRGA